MLFWDSGDLFHLFHCSAEQQIPNFPAFDVAIPEIFLSAFRQKS
jgi:hypothetical protein